MQGNTCKVQCAPPPPPPQAAWCRTTLLQVTDCSPTCVSGASLLWAWPLLQAVKCRTDRRRHTAAGTIRRTSSRSARCINEQAEVNMPICGCMVPSQSCSRCSIAPVCCLSALFSLCPRDCSDTWSRGWRVCHSVLTAAAARLPSRALRPVPIPRA